MLYNMHPTFFWYGDSGHFGPFGVTSPICKVFASFMMICTCVRLDIHFFLVEKLSTNRSSLQGMAFHGFLFDSLAYTAKKY